MRPHLWLIHFIGVIVPRRLRADWRQEWESELRCREFMLADWDRLDWHNRFDLLRRSTGAFWDALWLQPRRLEDDVFQDLRYGVRMLIRHPGFTAVAVLTLALGIGANTGIFTLLDKVLIRPLPVERADRLVRFVNDASGEPGVVSYPFYVDLRDGNQVLAGLAAHVQRPFSLSDGMATERVVGEIVSGNYFDVLGVQPALGRFFLPEEDRTPGIHPVAVISHSLWRRRFGADPAAIGKTVAVNGSRYAIVGVAPSEFYGATRGTASEVYVPVMMQAQLQPDRRNMLANRNAGWLRLIGRLKPNVGRDQAQAALSILAVESGSPNPGPKGPGKFAPRILLMDGSRGHTERVQDFSMPLKLMMGVVGFVLLIACANVANLLLARASERGHEIAVRLAVGASRWRIVRQLLTESAVLTVVGGGAGLAIAGWFAALLSGFQQQSHFVPRTVDASLDRRALVFTVGVSLLTAILFSLMPALHASRRDLVPALKKDHAWLRNGWRRVSVRNLLVMMQVALSLVVLIGAALCVKSLRALQAIDPGFEPASVTTASFDLGLSGYDETRGQQFVADLSGRVAALPGVEAVGVASIVAFSDLFWISGATVDGYQAAPGERMAFDFNAIGPNYFRTLGTPLVGGRDFTAQDAAGAPRVVIVNEAAARRYWPGQDAVGRRTSRGDVVGVVRDSKEKGLTQESRPAMYLPLLQNYVGELTLHVRTATDRQGLLNAVRREVHALDATLPLHNLGTLAEQKDGSLYVERLAAALLTMFALLALVVATVGIYGVLSSAVIERTHEMGIRRACGAQTGDLVRLVIGQGMLPTLIGVVIGMAGALALTRLLQSLLFNVSATDPLTFALIPMLLIAVALVACYLPARRSASVDPLAAIRCE